ncbi:hypothetical protein K438DRAFT_1770045 [Mycena galopus ATCC 62051]|nr:hypothetical protein K438DRAFT_1770045 [Mycena galopus ATCC 62051]
MKDGTEENTDNNDHNGNVDPSRRFPSIEGWVRKMGVADEFILTWKIPSMSVRTIQKKEDQAQDATELTITAAFKFITPRAHMHPHVGRYTEQENLEPSGMPPSTWIGAELNGKDQTLNWFEAPLPRNTKVPE